MINKILNPFQSIRGKTYSFLAVLAVAFIALACFFLKQGPSDSQVGVSVISEGIKVTAQYISGVSRAEQEIAFQNTADPEAMQKIYEDHAGHSYFVCSVEGASKALKAHVVDKGLKWKDVVSNFNFHYKDVFTLRVGGFEMYPSLYIAERRMSQDGAFTFTLVFSEENTLTANSSPFTLVYHDVLMTSKPVELIFNHQDYFVQNL
jgi:hypothetical protein